MFYGLYGIWEKYKCGFGSLYSFSDKVIHVRVCYFFLSKFFFQLFIIGQKDKTFKLNTNTNKIVYVFCKYLNKRVIHPPLPPGITWNIKTLNDFINPFLLIFSESIPGFFLNIINLKEILPYLNNHVHLITMCYKMIFFTILCWQQHPIHEHFHSLTGIFCIMLS